MKPLCFVVGIALGACAVGVHAQTNSTVFRVVKTPEVERGMALIDVSDLFEPGMTDTASKVFGYPGRRIGLHSESEPRNFARDGTTRESRNSRAWGLSVGVEAGPVTLRAAHQNKNVAKVAPAVALGNRMDAKNSLIAAHVDLAGYAKVYTAYSASRGWGSSPLWNPDNPYGAAIASTPSTDSRDVLMGVAVPYGHTTFLASFVRKNDRDLANRDVDMVAFGATYQMSRRTDFYAAYSLVKTRTGNESPGRMLHDDGKGWSALNVGMRHSF